MDIFKEEYWYEEYRYEASLGTPWWRVKQAKVAKVYASNPELSTRIYAIVLHSK
jgi:hypothetical protein